MAIPNITVPAANLKAISGILPVSRELSTNENAIAEKNIPEAKKEMLALILGEYSINIGTMLPIRNADDTIAEKMILCSSFIGFNILLATCLTLQLQVLMNRMISY